MVNICSKLEQILKLAGFKDFEVKYENSSNKISLIIRDNFALDKEDSLIQSLEHLVNLIYWKQNPELAKKQKIILDINHYRKRREELIIRLSQTAAQKVIATKKKVELPPMNSYERRLVHLTIKNYPSLTTESVGEEPNRRVVIKLI